MKSALFQGRTYSGSQSENPMEGQIYHLKGDGSDGLLDDYQNCSEKDNEAIHGILTKIISKWRTQGAKTEEESLPTGSGEEELAEWATSHRLSQWPSSNDPDEKPLYKVSEEEEDTGNSLDLDDSLVKATVSRSERKMRGKKMFKHKKESRG